MHHQTAPSFFDGSNRGLACDAGILLQKLVQSLAAFQIVDRSFKGNTGSAKHRFTTKDKRVFNDDLAHGFRLHCYIILAGRAMRFQPAWFVPRHLQDRGALGEF